MGQVCICFKHILSYFTNLLCGSCYNEEDKHDSFNEREKSTRNF